MTLNEMIVALTTLKEVFPQCAEYNMAVCKPGEDDFITTNVAVTVPVVRSDGEKVNLIIIGEEPDPRFPTNWSIEKLS
jgi:hypothetical protein